MNYRHFSQPQNNIHQNLRINISFRWSWRTHWTWPLPLSLWNGREKGEKLTVFVTFFGLVLLTNLLWHSNFISMCKNIRLIRQRTTRLGFHFSNYSSWKRDTARDNLKNDVLLMRVCDLLHCTTHIDVDTYT